MLVNPARSVLSAPLLVASWIVARTRRLRVGTAVQLLPLNHPLRVAGEVTTLDHLSQGRFDFGIGRSGGTARLRRARRPVRGEPGALLRGARDHPRGLEGRALQLRGQVLSLHRRHGHAAPVSAAASAGPDGRDDRRDVSARRPDGLADLRRAARHGHSRADRPREALSRRRGARRAIPATATCACASRCTPRRPRRPRATSRARPSRTTSSARPISRARRSAAPAPARSSSARRQAERLASLSYDEILDDEGRVRHRPGAGRSPRPAPRGARPERDRRRAEPRRALADGAGDAEPRRSSPSR